MTSYDAFVPANTSATLYLPVSAALEIPQGMEVTGTLTHNGLDCICLELPAGSWHFGA